MNRTSPFNPTKEEYEIFNIPVEYPESDGEPLAESDFQLVWIIYLLDALRYFFRQQEDVYVAGNLLIYYEEGYPPSSIAPDIFVAFGVGNHKRKTYKIWEEGETPRFILEILSASTVLKDRADKKGLYEFLGVQEYFLFDPIGNLMPAPQLQGYHLVNGRYQPAPARILTNGGIALTSAVLGLELHIQDDALRLFNRQAGHYLLTYEEAEAARNDAEARIAELEARLRALGEDV
jgi:Uma2 family endonuclease